jgi:hypothetical protein
MDGTFAIGGRLTVTEAVLALATWYLPSFTPAPDG